MEYGGKTRALLLRHIAAYPQLQIRDLFKFLYQSAFGCEHMALPQQQAAEMIRQEHAAAANSMQPLIEPLDGPYSRVHLAYMDHGMSVETLAKLFIASAKKEENAEQAMEEKLQAAKALAKENACTRSNSALRKLAAKPLPDCVPSQV